MEDDLISIVLPVFNGENYLKDSIDSCLNLTYKNIELIIVNDGSTDDSFKIATEAALFDDRIHVINNKANKNLPSSLNIGHEKATGKYITWTSHDNCYQKDAISVMQAKLKASEVDVVYTDYLLISENGDLIGKTLLKPIEHLLFYGVIGACFLYRKEVFLRNGGYNETLFLVEDYDFWLRALKHSTFSKIDNPGYYYYRYHSQSLTMKIRTDQKHNERFLENLNQVYMNLFRNMGLDNSQLMTDYLLKRFSQDRNKDILVLENPTFFEDLEKICLSLKEFRFQKMKSIILKDLIESILSDKNFQKISFLIKLHIKGQRSLLKIPINRYLALYKKCFF